ncbi:MAG: enolase C-terminal domain-like protein [Acidobacteriota bacterium]
MPAFAVLASRMEALAQAPAQIITAVEFWRYEGTRDTAAGTNNRQFQVQPSHIYDELRPAPYHEAESPARKVAASAVYLKIRTQSGLEGMYGPIDAEVAPVVDRQLKGLITGKNALAVEQVWDMMYRSNRHSRAGHYMMAMSAVDNCLWDLRGRYYNTPVYRLLGGPTRTAIQCYGSCLGYSVEPDRARAVSTRLKAEGFLHQKWFIPYGPGSGAEGLAKNVDLVANLRSAVGDEVDLMFDASQGWSLDYAIAWCKRVEKYSPRWIEEAFPMERMQSFVDLRHATSVPVATGEHFYGRWEVNEFLKAGAISVVQSDPEWCGGITELVKMCAIASLYDAQVIPHGHAIHAALHTVAAQSPSTCPLVEYLITSRPAYYYFEKNPPVPINGKITLNERPGFGAEIDEAKVEKKTLVKFT